MSGEEKTRQSKPREKTPAQAFLSLSATCSKMERCRSDARRLLYRWNISPSYQEKIIEKLVAGRFIDEQRYADAYVREKTAAGRWGPAKIIAGLRAKQIPEDIIRNAVESHGDQNATLGKLEKELRRRMQKESEKADSGYQLRVKLFRFAASRGFGFDRINDILDRLMKDEDF